MYHTQPIANPHAGSMNLVEYAENEPAMGNTTANSPRAWTVQYNIMPTKMKHISNDPGPPSARDFPDATKSPVPKNSQISYFLFHISYSRSTTAQRTNRPSKGYHLQMSALQLPRQRRMRSGIGRAYRIEFAASWTGHALRNDDGVRLPLEGIEELLYRAAIIYRGVFEIRPSPMPPLVGVLAFRADLHLIALVVVPAIVSSSHGVGG